MDSYQEFDFISFEEQIEQIYNQINYYFKYQSPRILIPKTIKLFENPNFDLHSLCNYLHNDLSCDQQSFTNIKNKNYQVVLVAGETGHGKSTFINAANSNPKALESDPEEIESKTQELSIHTSDQYGIHLIDMPGFFDTGKLDNDKIKDKIISFIKEQLQEYGKIDAIMLVWSPTSCNGRFRTDMIHHISNSLGESCFDSMIFVGNQFSNVFAKNNAEQIQNTHEKICEMTNIEGIPFITGDFKTQSSLIMEEVQYAISQVRPYNKEYFDDYNKSCILQMIQNYLCDALQYRNTLIEREAQYREEQLRQQLRHQEEIQEEERKQKDFEDYVASVKEVNRLRVQDQIYEADRSIAEQCDLLQQVQQLRGKIDEEEISRIFKQE